MMPPTGRKVARVGRLAGFLDSVLLRKRASVHYRDTDIRLREEWRNPNDLSFAGRGGGARTLVT